jgi:tetratricopeptide (TPR) repeat protein
MQAADDEAPPQSAGAVPPIEQSVDGRYQVLELLGRGGMGAVYRVRDERSGREVALKRLLSRATGDALAAQLFEREFHTLSELAHPRIIEVYDYGVDGGGAYYTMELLGGQDLRALGKSDWRIACALLRDVASSLAILHSRRLVHGDLSPRNVRCTLDGRAKLLDFGAMMPMGVCKRVVGTPPFIAPEMVQLQPLDGRTDLYALGALAYFMLTGLQAYPARSVRQLRDVWRTAPRTPIELAPETPPALSQLVMELLQLNRNARPRTAGVVMERLCAIASLPLDEHADVAEAYLTTPMLVGREQQLASVRQHLIDATRGHGGVIVVQGASGSGRSRFLDGCVLEGKLLGSHVLRTDAGDAGQGSYGVARALCQQLFEVAPDAARRSAQLHGAVLAHVLGAELAGCAPAAERPDRRKLLAALRDLLLSAARSLRLVIAVDDADRIDEASASLLVALAHKTRRRPLCLILSMDSEGEGSAALDLLASAASRIELPPLDEAQTEQLLRSVFGDANHLLTVARRIHAIARGNPRAIMQLATHLVEQRIARYEAGSFILPELLREDELPRSLAATLARRMAALDPDALELARVLALTEPSELSTASYPELTAHGDRARTYRAIDQLLRAQVLDVEGDRYRLSDGAWRGVLSTGLTERVGLHARLARVFEQSGPISRHAYHLMESEQPEAAIRVLLGQYLKDPNEPRDPLEDYVPGMLDLLERAVLAAERLKLPAPLRNELRMKTAGASQFVGDVERFMRIAPPTLAQLHRESGLLDYEQLDPDMEPMARLTEALTRAQQRYDATPEAERGLPPADAVRELARCCAMFSGVATATVDPDLLECLPSLTPLSPLSPAISAIQSFLDATREMVQGRTQRACSMYLAVLERLAQPDRAGLGELYHKSIRLGSLYILGLAEAGAGLPNAGERVAELEREPGNRVNAQRVHLACQMMQGNVEEAAAAQRRAELVMLQDGQQQRYPNSTLRIELFAHVLADDLSGVKQITEQLVAAAKRFPRWSALVNVGRCHYRRIQGDFAGALEALQPALETSPLRNRDWTWIASTHVTVLTALGRAEEAVTLGLSYLELCDREALHPNHRSVGHATVEALTAVGRLDEAVALSERLIAEALAAGTRGLALGWSYELHARIAIARGDAADFRAFADLCATEYRVEHNPALAAKYERLLLAAVQGGLSEPTAPRRSTAAPKSSLPPSMSIVQSRMLECPDRDERARCALAILIEYIQPDQAFLYGLREGRATLMCALDDAPQPELLCAAVQRYVQRELEYEEATEFVAPQPSGAEPMSLGSGAQSGIQLETQATTLATDVSGRNFHPLLLASRREGQVTIAAVVALRFRVGQRKMPPPSVLEMVADSLIANDDVDPVTCIA